MYNIVSEPMVAVIFPRLIILLCLIMVWSFARGEELTVSTCEQKQYMISRYAVHNGVQGEEKEMAIDTFKLGKQVGVLDTGGRPFEAIFQAALKQEPDRFFGRGWTYILTSENGTHYVLFFEYEEYSNSFDGRRFGIGKLSDLGSGGAVFVGFKYDGRGKDEPILKQLKVITERILKEETKAERVER